jgi:3-oxoadipate enol-lactonase
LSRTGIASETERLEKRHTIVPATASETESENTCMSYIDADGCNIYVEIEGPQNAPILMLSNSLGTDLSVWDEQVAPFARHFHLIRYDRRGHGKSDSPNGPYSMERLCRDVLAIVDALGIARTNWCGLSMGGMVGQWLGANAADRIDKLIMSNTACYIPDKTVWENRIKLVREKGLRDVVDGTMDRWFTKEFRERAPQTIERMRKMFLATNPEGYAACGEAIRDMDHRPLLSKIQRPTLVIAGRFDPTTPPDMNACISERISEAKFTVLEAAHIANVEAPRAYTEAVLEFLLGQ